MEQMSRVHKVKLLGQDSIQCHRKEGKRRGEADYGNGVRAGEQRAERLRIG